MLLALLACTSVPSGHGDPFWHGPDAPVVDVLAENPVSTGVDVHGVPDAWSPVPIVIGAGPSGLAAAMDLGGALVLESADVVGGRARWSGGFLFLVGTEDQAALGIVDGPAAAEADWEALTGAPATDATRTFLAATDGIRDRLVGMGLSLRVDRPSPLLLTPREHAPANGGAGLIAALAAHLPDTVDVRLSTPVRGLVFVDGAVAGVHTDDGWIGADTVVIASGGFVDRADLVELHTGWAPGTFRMGTDYGATGDALDWAEEAGLGTRGLDAMGTFRDVLGFPGADGQAIRFEAGSGYPWVWVDGTGTRFVNESATWSLVLGGLASARSNVWAITTYESIAANLSAEDLAYLTEGDAWRCAADWEALADAIELDPAALADTMGSVAAIQARLEVDPLGRPSTTFGIRTGTPCAFRPGKVAAKSYGGLAVDADGRVLDAEGAVVPGLWAVGEAAGMGVPGLGGAWGFDGSLSAVLWSGWRTAAAIEGE